MDLAVVRLYRLVGSKVREGGSVIGTCGARTPEDLEMLFEDALVLRDAAGLAALFGSGAVLCTGEERLARGAEAAPAALATWEGERIYVAAPWRVILARDLALVVTERGANVARRGQDGCWRYAIVCQPVVDRAERS